MHINLQKKLDLFKVYMKFFFGLRNHLKKKMNTFRHKFLLPLTAG